MTADNLKKLRIELGLTIGRCAEDMKFSRQTIYNLENGLVAKPSTLKYYELYLKEVRRMRNYANNHRTQYSNRMGEMHVGTR